MAQFLYTAQIERFCEMLRSGSLRYCVMVLSIDETEQQIFVQGEHGTHHVMMLHSTVWQRSTNGKCFHEELALPPAVLSNTATPTLLSAVEMRTHGIFSQAGDASPGTQTVLVLQSDSALQMCKMARGYSQAATTGAARMFIHARCMHHMFFASLSAMLKPLDQISPMFCATILLHKASHMSALRSNLKTLVYQKIRIVYEPPSAATQQYASAIMRLLDGVDDAWLQEPEADVAPAVTSACMSKRREARQRLLQYCPGPWADSVVVYHVCAWNCPCRSVEGNGSASEKAAAFVVELVESALLDERPAIPALNRWRGGEVVGEVV